MPAAKDDHEPDDRTPAPASSDTVSGRTTSASEALADDDLHRKFREALDHKKSGSSGTSRSKGDGGKPHAQAGPAHQQRMFRRKSGG
jgi:hypothetical protein